MAKGLYFIKLGLGLMALGTNDFSRGNCLADVALGVVGDVDQQATDAGRQILLAHMPFFLQMRDGKGTDAAHALAETDYNSASSSLRVAPGSSSVFIAAIWSGES